MVSPTRIIITIEKKFNDEVDFNGGKLWMDVSFKPEWNVFPYGTVVSVPVRNPNLMEDDFVYNVQVGDKLYINYGVIMDDSNRIEHDGKEYWMVDYYMALAVFRDGKIIPCGKHLLVKPIEEEINSNLIIPDIAKGKKMTKGFVYASNDQEINEGDLVWFEKHGMFENDIEGNKLFVMFNSNVLCIEKI